MPHNEQYKEEKVSFVVSQNGTTSIDVLAVLMSSSVTPALSLLILPWLLPAHFTVQKDIDLMTFRFIRFLIEFPIVAILNLLVITLFASPESSDSDSSVLVYVILTLLCLLIVTVNHTLTRPKWASLKKQWSWLMDQRIGWENEEAVEKASPSVNKYPFLYNFRGLLFYLTVLSILAVDFKIFPRRHAKTKVFGVSLMDCGTASFVLANGIVSPEAKHRKSSIKKAIVGSIPLVILGLARALAVKATDYHEIVEEYGVHWNFFLTLASVKILSALIFAIHDTRAAGKLCVIVTIIYQLLLTSGNLQDGYLLNEKISRSQNFMNANREGIFSAFGYLAVFCGSAYVGQILYDTNRRTIRDWLNYVLKNVKISLLLWLAYNACLIAGIQPCRRVANAAYIIWILAVDVTLLSFATGAMILLSMGQSLGILHGPMISYHLNVRNQRSDDQRKEAAEEEHQMLNNDQALQALSEIGEEINRLSVDSNKVTSVEDRREQLDRILSSETKLKKLDELLRKQQHQNKGDSDDSDKFKTLPNLVQSSILYEAVCYNGLTVFLFSNLLTGMVNHTVYTVHATTVASTAYMIAYTFVIYSVSVGLYAFQIQLKWW